MTKSSENIHVKKTLLPGTFQSGSTAIAGEWWKARSSYVHISASLNFVNTGIHRVEETALRRGSVHIQPALIHLLS